MKCSVEPHNAVHNLFSHYAERIQLCVSFMHFLPLKSVFPGDINQMMYMLIVTPRLNRIVPHNRILQLYSSPHKIGHCELKRNKACHCYGGGLFVIIHY